MLLWPYGGTMKNLLQKPHMRFFQVCWQFRLINFKGTHTIIEQKVFAILYSLPPTFRFFLPTPKATLVILSASLPTGLQLFWRTTRIVLINDALFGDDASVSRPRPIVTPSQTISIPKGTGFGPGHVIVPQQRHHFLEGQGKIYPGNVLFRQDVLHHDAPDEILSPRHPGKKFPGVSNIEFVYVKLQPPVSF